ncbi:MAG: hypothetical protein RL026_2490 [Pseudomonadota bacterium]|jgi:uncharacterized iron-regulated membrane protein
MSARRAWLTLHLWLGLSLGLWFVLVGLTGSLLVFYPQIDRWLQPRPAVEGHCTGPLAWQPVLEALQAAAPAGATGRWRLELPRGPGVPVHARLQDAAAASKLHAPLLFSVDPCTLQVVPRGRWGETAMTFVYDLHYQLLLEHAGREAVGWGGLVLCLSLASGLLLWWPRGAWWPALRPQWRRGAARRTWDLHTRAGVYGSGLLLLLALTGSLLAWPARLDSWLQPLSPPRSTPALAARPLPGQSPISVDVALRAARHTLPDAEPRWMDTPADAQGVFRIRLRQPGDPGDRFPHSYVWIDAYDGRVLAVHDARRQGAGDALLAWLHPLHNGEALGLAGRWLVLVSGLLPALLAITGWLRWRQKRAPRGRLLSDRR